MMVPCACCGVVCEPEPYLYINFATHRGPLCPACFQAWSDSQSFRCFHAQRIIRSTLH